MPRAEQRELLARCRLRADGIELPREASLAGPEVELRQRVECLAQLACLGRHERRQLVEDALLLRFCTLSCASRHALPSSTTTSGSMKSVWPLPDWSCTMPLTLLFASARTGTT